jgi:MinD-like ATPase involved in chromosome partitioning or flagellar assembly
MKPGSNGRSVDTAQPVAAAHSESAHPDAHPGAQPAARKVHVVGVHSCRGGCGKSTVAANLAYLAARRGARVGIVDGDLQAPALHRLLGVETKRVLHSVSEFVKSQCELSEVPIDLSRELGIEEPGTLFFLPASVDLPTTASILFDGYDVARLNEHMRRLAEELELELLILDTHLGINRESLLSLSTSDTVLVLVRPDGQDRQEASLLVQIATKVGVPSCLVVPSMVLEEAEAARNGKSERKAKDGKSGGPPEQTIEQRMEQELGVPVAGVLPWCRELSELGCQGLFAARHRDHPLTAELERICQRLGPAAEVPPVEQVPSAEQVREGATT